MNYTEFYKQAIELNESNDTQLWDREEMTETPWGMESCKVFKDVDSLFKYMDNVRCMK